MRFILNMSHARCLFAQRVYAAQLTPGVLQKALPSSSAMINKIFKAIPFLRGEKPAGTKGRAELILLLVLSTKKSSPKAWTWLCGIELRDSSVSFAGGGAAVPPSPSLGTPTRGKLRQRSEPPGGLIHPRGQRHPWWTIPSPPPPAPVAGRAPRPVARCHALSAPSPGCCCPRGRPARPPAPALGHVVLRRGDPQRALVPERAVVPERALLPQRALGQPLPLPPRGHLALEFTPP